MILFETKDVVIFEDYNLEKGLTYKKALIIEKNKRMYVLLEIIELVFDEKNKAEILNLERELINNGFAVRGAKFDGLNENNLVICGNEFRMANNSDHINIKKVGVFNNDYKFNIILNKYFTFKNNQFSDQVLKNVLEENRQYIRELKSLDDTI